MIAVLNEYKGTFEVTKEFYEVFKECQNYDPSRHFMTCVYFDGEQQTFVATDGKRMVYHKDGNFPSTFQGQYELAKIGKKYKLIPKEEDGQFPNWMRVVPDLEKYHCVKIADDYTCGLSGKLPEDSMLICEIILETKAIFNIEFLTKVLKHVPSFEIQQHSEDGKALFFDISEVTKYIVMPMDK